MSTPRFHTLVNLSGGIDSTFALLLYAQSGVPVVVHHCHLINWTKRAPLELEAVHNVLAWIGQGYSFECQFVQTQFDYGNLSIVLDKEIIGFLNGILLRDARYFGVQNIVVSSNREDVNEFGYYLQSEAQRMRLIEAAGRRPVNYLYPIANLSREEIMRRMPRELLELCWYCRTPAGAAACGNCKTCKKVLPILEKLNGAAGGIVSDGLDKLAAGAIKPQNHEPQNHKTK